MVESLVEARPLIVNSSVAQQRKEGKKGDGSGLSNLKRQQQLVCGFVGGWFGFEWLKLLEFWRLFAGGTDGHGFAYRRPTPMKQQ